MSIAALILAIILVFVFLGPFRSRMVGPWNLLWVLVFVLLILAVAGRV